MTVEEYLKKLSELRTQAERSFITDIPSLEKYAYNLMVDYSIATSIQRAGNSCMTNGCWLRLMTSWIVTWEPLPPLNYTRAPSADISRILRPSVISSRSFNAARALM